MRRSTGMVILFIVVSALIGSALSYVLANVFPSGPVYNLLFKVISFGIPQFTLDAGFLVFTLGLTLSITGLTILCVILAIILMIKF
ncbi:MAG: DUF4321 domain-containing protein [Ignavibacteria bacterium]|nr:DUF4321 domain-containing protein [Ignavibacteria bacterium]